jgi:hypothetical protein
MPSNTAVVMLDSSGMRSPSSRSVSLQATAAPHTVKGHCASLAVYGANSIVQCEIYMQDVR